MYDYKNKEGNVTMMNQYTLLKTLTMFRYTDLPETLNALFIEKQLQTVGYVFITEHKGKLYAFNGALGGELDVYGEPTKITINNPYIDFNKTLDVKEDGVLLQNNALKLGLMPIMDRYNTLLVENEVTMFITTYNARMQTLISAGDDATKQSAEIYLEKLINGELGIIAENRVFEGISTSSTAANSTNDITKLVEFHQYIKASLYNEIGLNANFNMKRERLNSSEVELNTDSLYPMIDNMHESRFNGIQQVNEMFNTNIGVHFDSAWERDEVVEGIVEENVEDDVEDIVEDSVDVEPQEPTQEEREEDEVPTMEHESE